MKTVNSSETKLYEKIFSHLHIPEEFMSKHDQETHEGLLLGYDKLHSRNINFNYRIIAVNHFIHVAATIIYLGSPREDWRKTRYSIALDNGFTEEVDPTSIVIASGLA